MFISDRGPQIRRPPTKPEAHSGSQVSPKVRTSRCKPPLLSPLKSEIRGLSKSPPGRSPASILTRRAVEKKRDSEKLSNTSLVEACSELDSGADARQSETDGLELRSLLDSLIGASSRLKGTAS
uniref:Atx10homo_assoc domain-containing protein n=1 Tax=Mesocestoides corti TaxID=53468 RepID=A0A5K3FIQ5_MESCO